MTQLQKARQEIAENTNCPLCGLPLEDGICPRTTLRYNEDEPDSVLGRLPKPIVFETIRDINFDDRVAIITNQTKNK